VFKFIKYCFLLIPFCFNQNILKSEEAETNFIKCEVKQCNPKLRSTFTVWYKGDKSKPAIIWFAGGDSTSTEISYQPIALLKGKFDIIMVASPLPIVSNKSTDGFPRNAYNKYSIYRSKQVLEYYKKKLNKPIWLGGTSSGGPRMIGVLSGNEKDRPSDEFAGLIFSSPYLARINSSNGSHRFNIRVSKIKYKMDLPILVFNHARDHKAAQHPKKQEWFTKQLAKKNSNKTELKLLTEGDPKITYHDGGHHWFEDNKEEVARVVEKFILDNTK